MSDQPASSEVHTPLRSDPPWLRAGLVAVTLASVLLFGLYYRKGATSRPPIALALLPGLSLAVFAGAAMAWWGRRRGGTMSLETTPHRLVLQEPRTRQEILDRTRPFGAVLVTDKHSGARALVLSQHAEPTVLYDPDRNAGKSAPAGFQNRTVPMDLGHVALSPDSSHVITPTVGTRIDPVLESLSETVQEQPDWLHYPLPSGEVLHLTASELRIGDRVATIGKGSSARRIAIQSPAGEIVALSILCDENSFLLACQDMAGAESVTPVEAPDAYLPVLVWSIVAERFGVETRPLAATSGEYRG